MRKQSKSKKQSNNTESDGEYLLKIVLYVILGALWLKFANPIVIGDFAIRGLPVGLVVGLIFASHEKFQVDRKIEYVLLIVMAVLGFFLPVGIVL